MKKVFCICSSIACIAASSFTFASCGNPTIHIDKIVKMSDLYNGYERTTEIHEPDKLNESKDGLGFYFNNISSNKDIVIDDIFSAIAKMPFDLTIPCQGKMGIGISNINLEKYTFSWSMCFDNVFIDYKIIPEWTDEVWIKVWIDGYVEANNTPFDITHDDKSFGPWMGHQWWLGLDIATIFDFPDKDINWSVIAHGTIKYEYNIGEHIGGELAVDGEFSYYSKREKLRELYDIICNDVIGAAYIPLQYMEDVESLNDPVIPPN